MGLIMAFTQYPVLEQMYWKWKNKSFQKTSFFKVLTMVNCHVCISGRQTNPFKNDQKSTAKNLIMCLPKF